MKLESKSKTVQTKASKDESSLSGFEVPEHKKEELIQFVEISGFSRREVNNSLLPAEKSWRPNLSKMMRATIETHYSEHFRALCESVSVVACIVLVF